ARRGRRIGEDERRPPVAGDERAVAGRGVRRDPGARDGRGDAPADAREAGSHLRRADVRARGQGDDRDQRGAVAAVPEHPRDRGVRDVALAAGHRVLVAQRPRRGAGRDDAGEGHGQPREGDQAAVPECESGDGDHALHPRNGSPEPKRPPGGTWPSSRGRTRILLQCDSDASGGRYPRRGMHASNTRPWTPRDVVVAVAVFVLTLGLLAHGHGSTRAIDAPGVALAAVATLPLVYHRRWPLAVFALTTAASAAINALGYQAGPPFGPTVALFYVASDDRTRLRIGPTAAVVLGMFAVHLGATAIAEGGFPTTPILFGVVVW